MPLQSPVAWHDPVPSGAVHESPTAAYTVLTAQLERKAAAVVNFIFILNPLVDCERAQLCSVGRKRRKLSNSTRWIMANLYMRRFCSAVHPRLLSSSGVDRGHPHDVTCNIHHVEDQRQGKRTRTRRRDIICLKITSRHEILSLCG